MKTFVMFLGLTAVVFAQDNSPDQDLLQGTWQAVSIVENNKEAPAEIVKMSQLIIKQNQFMFKGAESYRGTFSLDAAKKPKWIDTTFVDEDTKAKGRAVGIYELDGDQLKIAWRHKGNDRPKDFTSKADSGVRSMVLKRQK